MKHFRANHVTCDYSILKMHSKNQPLKKSLLEMAGDGKFISGICNYCNRWCERCSKTQNCLSFASEQFKKGIDAEQINNDTENKKFWNAIEEILKLDSNDLIKSTKVKFAEKDSQNNLILLARQYENSLKNWFTKNSFSFEEKAKLVVAYYNNKNIIFSDATEILKWYSKFISKRILRSLNNLNERKTGNPEDAKNPYLDNIGSAKNTILACDHSMAAFTLLYAEMEEHQNEIQIFINQLIEIKNRLLEIFPEVLQFKRPGFDR